MRIIRLSDIGPLVNALPIRGTATIELRDVLGFRLALLWYSKWIVPLFLALAVWFILAQTFQDLAAVRGKDLPDTLPRIGALARALMFVSGYLVLGFALLLFALSFNLLLMGRERRTLSYEFDDVRFVTRDALGAELAIPWSNVRRPVYAFRLLLLRLKPRGWRFVILRAFDPPAVKTLRRITAGLK